MKITSERILDAEKDFDKEKYPIDLYTWCLEKLETADQAAEEVQHAVNVLFHWKLGKVSARKTTKSSPVKLRGWTGKQYYLVKTTNVHRGAIKKSIQLDAIRKGIQFRRCRISQKDFTHVADNLTSRSVVLPAFLLHIWRPKEYPILDEMVWKAYLGDQGGNPAKNSKPSNWSHYEQYIRFFKALEKETQLGRLKIDHGMWAIGKRIKRRIMGKCR